MRPSLLNRLRHQFVLMGVALQCLTRITFPTLAKAPPAWQQHSMAFFPVVGALIGLLSGLVLAAASAWWPPAVAVGVSMAFSAWFTRAIHEQSWAHCGAPLAPIFVLGLKAAVLVALVSPQITELNDAQSSHVRQVLLVWAWMGLIWCHAASRLVPVLIGVRLPSAGPPAPPRIERPQALAALGTTLSVWLAMWLWMWLSGWPTGTLMQAMAHSAAGLAIGGVAAGLWLNRGLGGSTGHGLGAAQQLSELAGLMGWLMVIRP